MDSKHNNTIVLGIVGIVAVFAMVGIVLTLNTNTGLAIQPAVNLDEPENEELDRVDYGRCVCPSGVNDSTAGKVCWSSSTCKIGNTKCYCSFGITTAGPGRFTY